MLRRHGERILRRELAYLRLSGLERFVLCALVVVSVIGGISECSLGAPGPEPGWTTHTFEGLKLALPSSWTVHRRNRFLNRVDGIHAYLEGPKSPGNDRFSLRMAVEDLVDRAEIYKAASAEASRVAWCRPREPNAAVRVTEASVPGAWGLVVEGCDPDAPSLTLFLLSDTRTFTIRLIQTDANPTDAATVRHIVELLRF